jgi:hypothetical protein
MHLIAVVASVWHLELRMWIAGRYRGVGMTTSPIEHQIPLARNVAVSDAALVVELVDGRTITVPLPWYPRLSHGTREERANWRLIGGGEGIHWPDLDEDISVENLLSGKRSDESDSSLRRWIESRR